MAWRVAQTAGPHRLAEASVGQRGEVVIGVEELSRTAQDVELHFSVKDTGIGIPLSKQQHVFSAFAQADGSSTRTFGGTGLGLTIKPGAGSPHRAKGGGHLGSR